MTKRTSLSIALIAVVLLVAAGVVFFLFRSSGSENNSDSRGGVSTTNASTSSGGGANDAANVDATTNATVDGGADAAPVEVTEAEDQKSVLNLSRIFVERYGSYSNRNNFENITSLEPFMTTQFQAESLAYIDANQNEGMAEEYYGISTYVMSLELTAYVKDETARARLATRREESRSDEERKVFTQYVQVVMESVDGTWKVDTVTWE